MNSGGSPFLILFGKAPFYLKQNRVQKFAYDVPHLVNTCLDLLIDGETGIWHLANKGSLSWAEFAFLVADKFHLNKSAIHAVNATEINYLAGRPFNSALASERAQLLPSLEYAIKEFVEHRSSTERSLATICSPRF